MIYHSIRASIKPGIPEEKVEDALNHLRRMGEEIPAVEFYCVGKDIGGEFSVGAMFALKDIDAYKEYMLHPLHRVTDDVGLPLVENMISQDLTDDEDPQIGDKIRAIHASRFEDDPALLNLVNDLNSYTGSGMPNQ